MNNDIEHEKVRRAKALDRMGLLDTEERIDAAIDDILKDFGDFLDQYVPPKAQADDD